MVSLESWRKVWGSVVLSFGLIYIYLCISVVDSGRSPIAAENCCELLADGDQTDLARNGTIQFSFGFFLFLSSTRFSQKGCRALNLRFI